MKKKHVKLYVILFIAAVALIFGAVVAFYPSDFSIDEYSQEIERYSDWGGEGLYTEPIDSKPEALIEAIKLFENRYTFDEFTYVVAYDRDNDCWLVQGRVYRHRQSAGGVDNVIIRSDGEVIAIWIER